MLSCLCPKICSVCFNVCVWVMVKTKSVKMQNEKITKQLHIQPISIKKAFNTVFLLLPAIELLKCHKHELIFFFRKYFCHKIKSIWGKFTIWGMLFKCHYRPVCIKAKTRQKKKKGIYRRFYWQTLLFKVTYIYQVNSRSHDLAVSSAMLDCLRKVTCKNIKFCFGQTKL